MSTGQTTRDMIIQEADRLFYQRGFDHTSFADIAGLVNISRGNLYHHFKTKDDILYAVIDFRRQKLLKLLDKWEQDVSSPVERIKQFFSFFSVNREKIRLYGCPLGTLCNEMAKLEHSAKGDVVEIYDVCRLWLSQQFEAMGYSEDVADHQSLHILAQSQGIANIFTAYQDDRFVERELERVYDWLDAQVVR